MFHAARLKLTAWYLLIIMSVSLLFSAAIYRSWMYDMEHMMRRQRYRIESKYGTFDVDIFEEARNRLLSRLALINGVIFFLSGGLGYFLAGRTLKPIQDIVEEQKRFITDASHELRTPLTSIKSEIEVGLRDKNMSLGDAKIILSSNLEEVNNLQALSDRLIELTQYEQNGSKLTYQSVPLSTALTNAVKKVAPLAKKKHIIIAVPSSELSVFGDEERLTELFVIFFDNAVKYSTAKSEISVTARKLRDKTIEVAVKDQGIGIDPVDIPHIFDRFYRSDTSRTKHDIHGYGLGLSIAKKIIDIHGGSIRVESRKNKGTAFFIRLPVGS